MHCTILLITIGSKCNLNDLIRVVVDFVIRSRNVDRVDWCARIELFVSPPCEVLNCFQAS